jgi:sterol desaturase/sphingolipid hydroxylase (fatty acid hydroxylase superfamily)
MMRATPESPRMFKSDFADLFSRTPWWSIPIIWGPVVGGLFYYGLVEMNVAWHFIILQGLIGAIFWTFSEYWLHRMLFHWEPEGVIGQKLHFIMHGCHHTWIDDKYRLVMPPVAGFIIATPFWMGFTALSGLLSVWVAPTWTYAVFGGFLGGYINYDMTHYATHHMKVKSKRLIQIRAHHMNHHFNDSERRFGISTAFWDRCFGTN